MATTINMTDVLNGEDKVTVEAIAEGVCVNLSGDTVTGQIKGITPIAPEDLTRKDYVDTKNDLKEDLLPTQTDTTDKVLTRNNGTDTWTDMAGLATSIMADQSEVDAGLVTDETVSPSTLKNSVQWDTKENVLPLQPAVEDRILTRNAGVDTWELSPLGTDFYATQAEVDAGTVDDNAISPKTFNDAAKWLLKEDVLPTQNTGNDMVLNRNSGIDTWIDLTSVTDFATQIEVDNGIVGTKSVAPDTLINHAKWLTKLNLIGGTMTGQIKGIMPVDSQDLTRKDYVDSQDDLKEDKLPTQGTSADLVLNRNAGVDSWVPMTGGSGTITYATQAEVDAGIIADEAVAPNTLKASAQWDTKEDLLPVQNTSDDLVLNRNAGVDSWVAQTGAAFATQAEVDAGTVTDKTVAPDTLGASAQWDTKVDLAGDTMTGMLTLAATPSLDMHAATKKYVDDNITSGAVYKGQWDASTNSPTLIDGTGVSGDYYNVSIGGTQNLGSGSITYALGDQVKYDGSIWGKIDAVGAVTYASQAEVDTGTESAKAVNPLTLKNSAQWLLKEDILPLQNVADDRFLMRNAGIDTWVSGATKWASQAEVDAGVATKLALNCLTFENAAKWALYEPLLPLQANAVDMVLNRNAGVDTWKTLTSLTPYATQAEVNAGVVADKTVSPLTLKASTQWALYETLLPTQAVAEDRVLNRNAGVDSWVTTASLGAYATQAEVNAGTISNEAVTPLTLKSSSQWALKEDILPLQALASDKVLTRNAGVTTWEDPPSGGVRSDTTEAGGGSKVGNMVSCSQATYDGLTPDSDTIYMIV